VLEQKLIIIIKFPQCHTVVTSILLLHSINGVGTNCGVGVGETRPEGPRAGDGVLGEGTASPSSPTRGFAGVL